MIGTHLLEHLLKGVDYAMRHPQVAVRDLQDACGVSIPEAKELLTTLARWQIVSSGRSHWPRRVQVLPQHRQWVLQLIADHRGVPPTSTGLEQLTVPGLTVKEHRVLDLAAEGYERSEIGQRLCLSSSTVKTHETRIRARLGARNRAHMVSLAYQLGHLPNPYMMSGKDGQ